MTALEKNAALAARLNAITAHVVTLDDARTLRRAALVLHRWAEAECGLPGYAVERDDAGIPWAYNPDVPSAPRRRVADREAGALRRVAETCDRLGLHWYHQPDPRGCSLYVSSEPFSDSSYWHGVAVY